MTTPASSLTRQRWAASCAVAALFILLMLPNLIWLWFAHDATAWVSAALFPVLLLLLPFVIFGNRLWIACLMLAPFALVAPIEAFYIVQYRHPTGSEVLATIVASNPRETREYLGSTILPLAASIIASLGLAVLAARSCHRSGLRMHARARAWLLTILLGTPVIAVLVAMASAGGSMADRLRAATVLGDSFASAVEPGFPFGLLQRVADYRQEWTLMRKDVGRLASFRFHAHRTTKTRGRQIYVLVVGESSRRNRWQLFGYARPTNPELAQTPHLIVLPDVLSSWPESITAIPLLLTRKPVTQFNANFDEASILRAMQEAGYETYWISNQLAIGRYDSPVSTYAYEAQHVIFLNHASWNAPGSYDEDLLPSLRHAVADSDHDLFIVLHMMGSHLGYDMRYPPSFARFRPTYSENDSPVVPGERLGNSYDNTIVYTDHVLAQVIAILKGSGTIAAMWFASDHGEALSTPTCSQTGHGFGTEFEFKIPALFWYSDAYASAFPERLAILRSNANKPALSADTFETLIDMAGVDFLGHQESRSLFSQQWKYRPRITNGAFGPVDYDKATFGKECRIVMPPASADEHASK